MSLIGKNVEDICPLVQMPHSSLSFTPMVHRYFSLLHYFMVQKNYGPDTILLFQCGDFYEIYEYDSDEDPNAQIQFKIGNAKEIASLLLFRVARKSDTKPHSSSNIMFAGFKTLSFEKQIEKLFSAAGSIGRYPIIIQVVQTETYKTDSIRYIAAILTDATSKLSRDISELGSNQLVSARDNFLVSVVIEHFSSKEYKIPSNGKPTGIILADLPINIGISVMNTLTGETWIYSSASKEGQNNCALQDLNKCLISYAPKELLIYFFDLPKNLMIDSIYYNFLNNYCNFKEIPFVYGKGLPLQEISFYNPSYQKAFLEKVYCHDRNGRSKAEVRISETHEQSGARPKDAQAKRATEGSEGNSAASIDQLISSNTQISLTSYLILLQHCHDHNSIILKKLSFPNVFSLDILDPKNHLILTSNSALQLEILPNSGQDFSLLSIIDQTSTLCGKRLLKYLISNPMANPEEITKYYDGIDFFINVFKQTNGGGLNNISLLLRKMPDIESLVRKFFLGILPPKEFFRLFISLEIFSNILDYLGQIPIPEILRFPELSLLKSFLDYSRKTFVSVENLQYVKNVIGAIANLNQIDFKRFLFSPILLVAKNEARRCLSPNVYPKLDVIFHSILQIESILEFIRSGINNRLGSGKEICLNLDIISASKKKKDRDEGKDGKIVGFTVATKAILTDVMNIIKNIFASDPNYANLFLNFTGEKLNKGGYVLSSPGLKELFETYLQKTQEYDLVLSEAYSLFLSSGFYPEKNGSSGSGSERVSGFDISFLTKIGPLLAKMDYCISGAKVALTRSYCRPKIEVSSDGASYFKATNLRHPIVEVINCKEPYIGNDIELGGIDNKYTGYLAYGINSAGKSVLTKSVGLAVLLAQIGLFVPATEMVYSPYAKIITRLSGQDNIFKSQSHFGVEMSELNTILNNLGSNVLVLGDELCKGTEFVSGSAITLAALRALVRTKTHFILTTHMHELPSADDFPKEGIRVCHLSVTHCPSTGGLIYNRKLQPGQGDTEYGIAVCKSLNLPNSFISDAIKIRNKMMGNEIILSTKKSRYNSGVFMDSCVKCGSKEAGLHTHHILEQHTADSLTGLIQTDFGPIHKDHIRNLIVLCEKCHRQEHGAKETEK